MGPSIVIDGEAGSRSMEQEGSLQLQWGRRSSSTERLTELCVKSATTRASMGPSIVIDGETLSAASLTSGTRMLQWGRRSSSTESRTTPDGTPADRKLQWGLDRHRRRGSRLISLNTDCQLRFNGAVDRHRRRALGVARSEEHTSELQSL